jgi:hypothetical protein
MTDRWLAFVVGLLLGFALAVLIYAAEAKELETEWLSRTVPTSRPLVVCPNGREVHIKWARDPRTKISTGTLGVDIIERDGTTRPYPCGPRIPRIWCPGPKP